MADQSATRAGDSQLAARLHNAIVAELARDPAAVAEFNRLCEADQGWFFYRRALDRLARSEGAGFVRRQPGHVVAIDEARLRTRGPG